MNAILITSNERRHRYVATILAKELDLIAVVTESKPKGPSASGTGSRVIAQHFARRDVAERKWLGDPEFPRGMEQLDLANGQSNSIEAFSWIMDRNPRSILLFGSSIIRAPLLTGFEGRIINMHMGLSPYYRGSGTNFWPLTERRPEGVGATIHLAVPKVDAGAILTQVRPEPAVDDDSHDLGTKAIMVGAASFARVAAKHQNGEIVPVGQDLTKGRIFRRGDFGEAAVERMLRHFETGMMTEYIVDIEGRRAAMPIVDQL